MFVPNTVHFAWLRYDGQAKRLHIFLSNNSTRPTTPYLVAPLDLVAVLGSSSAFVALTGGSSTNWAWPTEHHLIYNLSIASGAWNVLLGLNLLKKKAPVASGMTPLTSTLGAPLCTSMCTTQGATVDASFHSEHFSGGMRKRGIHTCTQVDHVFEPPGLDPKAVTVCACLLQWPRASWPLCRSRPSLPAAPTLPRA